MKESISRQLIAGFASIALVLVASVGMTIYEVSQIDEISTRIVELRAPTARDSSEMLSSINGSLAALRGYMLTGEDKFRVERAQHWSEISRIALEMDELSRVWTSPENVRLWIEFKIILAEFETYQAQTERVTHTEDELPATKILVNEAIPLADILTTEITRMIDLERDLPATRERKNLLSVMADTRGATTGALTSIRAFLLTGDTSFQRQFDAVWSVNEQRFLELQQSGGLFGPEQLISFEKFTEARQAFLPLPGRMFQIRNSDRWNIANFILATEAVPRAERLLTILHGEVDDSGRRVGGLTLSQQILLHEDSNRTHELINTLLNTEWILMIIGLSLAGFIGLMTTRSVKLKEQDLDETNTALAATVDKLEESSRELVFQKHALDEHAIVSIADIKGNITYVNDKFCKISGYSKEELIGNNHRLLKSEVHPDGFYVNLWQTIADGRTWQGEICNVNKVGGHYWVKSTIVPTIDDSGRPSQYVAIRTEITTEKDKERALLDATVTADKANSAKSEFLSSMSHELRTPMNAILGFGQMLNFNTAEPLTEPQSKCVDQILKGGEHLLELIDQVLDLSAIEVGELKLSMEQIEVNQVCTECLSMVEQTAAEKGLGISISLSTPHTIKVDHVRFNQILLNLLSNAVKYNRDGGTVVLKTEDVPDNRIRISVIDTGPGISEQAQRGLFQPFNRLGREGGEIQGTGIGLTITKQLVEAMDGQIGYESTLGPGSNFWVEFAAMESAVTDFAAAVEASVTDDETAPSGSSGKVLYVEDNPANLRLMELIFETLDGISLISAHNAELGLIMAEQQRPELILMDINLPGMDGTAAMQHLAANDLTKHIPVFAVTAAAMKGDMEKGLAAGFKAYLTKPFKVPEVIETVKRELGV